MNPSEVHKRTYRLPARLEAQRSRESLKDKPFTPAEELSSWLPDEMCMACGAPVGTSQLYCSDECREQEQRDAVSDVNETMASMQLGPQNPSATSAASTTVSSKSAPSTSVLFSSKSGSCSTQEEVETSRFRYYCPPSPHLVAQRSTSAARPNGHNHHYQQQQQQQLPALSAFERSLLVQRCIDNQGPDSTASSNEESGSTNERRDSATSSASSPSTAPTVPSTPSPAVVADNGRHAKLTSQRAHDDIMNSGSNDDGDDDDEELNASDFRLPPSVTSSTAILMRQGPGRSTVQRHASDPSSVNTSQSYHGNNAAFSPTRERCDAPVSPTAPSSVHPKMSYARRPSSTNLPAPVLYSPALLANSGASSTKASAIGNRRRSLWTSGNGAAVSAGASRTRRVGTHQRGPSVIDDPINEGEARLIGSVKTSSSSTTATGFEDLRSAPGATTSSQAPMRRSLSDSASASSPQHPQPQSYGSASSSANRTLRAASHDSHRLSTADLCGRPGCSGSSINRNHTLEQGEPGVDITSGSRKSNVGDMGRPLGRHRHTHSARAGFNLAMGNVKGSFVTPSSAMGMAIETSLGQQTEPEASREEINDAFREVPDQRSNGEQEATMTDAVEHDRSMLQGRGRSKARGCRSVSRRSRSPPRAAARGRSKALHIEEVDRKGRIADSTPVPAVEPSSSSPISIAPQRSNDVRGGGYSSSSAGEDLDRAARVGRPDTSPRRGRSPVERRRRLSTAKANRQGEAHGHGALPSSPSSAAAPLREVQQKLLAGTRDQHQETRSYGHEADPGFDDVEDLDLEL